MVAPGLRGRKFARRVRQRARYDLPLIGHNPGRNHGYASIAGDRGRAPDDHPHRRPRPRRGIRAQPEVIDFNRDGKLDLLLGDFYTAYDFKPDLTDEQKQQVKDLIAEAQGGGKAFAAKMQAMQDDFRKRYPGDAIFSDKADKEWSEAYRALRASPEAKQMEAEEKKFADRIGPFIRSTRGVGEQSADFAKPHGHVWVFLRK
jgi:hypothetical protein